MPNFMGRWAERIRAQSNQGDGNPVCPVDRDFQRAVARLVYTPHRVNHVELVRSRVVDHVPQ